jgi:Transposase DDE domain
MLVDSQAVKNTCNASVESKGFCHYKATNGIKRHLAVDTLGFPFFTHCTKATMPDSDAAREVRLGIKTGAFYGQEANVSDDQGLIEMFEKNIEYFKTKPVNIAKITILLDHGYHLETIKAGLVKIYPGILSKVRFEQSKKPSKAEKKALGKFGFVPVKWRWVVERSNAWVERCKRPWSDPKK